MEIIKALCQQYEEHFKILGARISLFMCIKYYTDLINCKANYYDEAGNEVN